MVKKTPILHQMKLYTTIFYDPFAWRSEQIKIKRLNRDIKDLDV